MRNKRGSEPKGGQSYVSSSELYSHSQLPRSGSSDDDYYDDDGVLGHVCVPLYIFSQRRLECVSLRASNEIAFINKNWQENVLGPLFHLLFG